MAKLHLLCGVPASGKSTYAKIWEVNGYVILSSDGLREIISGDAENQDCSAQVFSIMETMAAYLLARNINVMVDATNTTKKARAKFIAIARKYYCPVHAHVFKVTPETAKARNKGRKRQVPEHVIDRMAAQLFAEPPTGDEVDFIDFH